MIVRVINSKEYNGKSKDEKLFDYFYREKEKVENELRQCLTIQRKA